MNQRRVSTTFFFILSLLGSLYLLGEAGLQGVGRSICISEGCALVGRVTRFSDLSMILIGFFALGLLALLSGLNLRRPKVLFDSGINLALMAALAGEGFFIGYQIFWLPEVCLFCLSVFGIFSTLGLLRLLSDWKAATAGFVVFAVVLCFVGLVLPPQGIALPSDKKMILFYSEECRYCEEIKEEINKNKLDITPVLIKNYSAILKNLGVDRVPTLLVTGRSEKLILTGKEAIHRYLFAGQSLKNSSSSWSALAPSPKKSNSKPPDSDALRSHSPWGSQNPMFKSSDEEGACQENQKCD
jgi:hypothetical protein